MTLHGVFETVCLCHFIDCIVSMSDKFIFSPLCGVAEFFWTSTRTRDSDRSICPGLDGVGDRGATVN